MKRLYFLAIIFTVLLSVQAQNGNKYFPLGDITNIRISELDDYEMENPVIFHYTFKLNTPRKITLGVNLNRLDNGMPYIIDIKNISTNKSYSYNLRYDTDYDIAFVSNLEVGEYTIKLHCNASDSRPVQLFSWIEVGNNKDDDNQNIDIGNITDMENPFVYEKTFFDRTEVFFSFSIDAGREIIIKIRTDGANGAEFDLENTMTGEICPWTSFIEDWDYTGIMTYVLKEGKYKINLVVAAADDEPTGLFYSIESNKRNEMSFDFRDITNESEPINNQYKLSVGTDVIYTFSLKSPRDIILNFDTEYPGLHLPSSIELTDRQGSSVYEYKVSDGGQYALAVKYSIGAGEYKIKLQYPKAGTSYEMETFLIVEGIEVQPPGINDLNLPVISSSSVDKTEYEYNIRSWIKAIKNNHFSQRLFYNESIGVNTPQFGGNISAMDWQIKDDNQRGYIFEYDDLSRLTGANYLVNGSAKNNYSTAYSYDKHGNILTTSRYGKTTAGETYGLVDNLTMTYNGNQLINIKDIGENITLSQSADFKDHAEGNGVYTYNKNGAMDKDTHKGITGIQYNSLNLPVCIEIDNGSIKGRTKYVYSASGVKLQVTHETDMNPQNAAVMSSAPFSTETTNTKVTDYVGNKIYEDGVLKKILVDGGYIDVETGEYYFYITDHLGNNRVVAKADGTVVQKSHYYPFGMEFAENSGDSDQPYKYNGKELDKMHGLNMYDYSARYYEPAVGRFTTVDPLAEKYYSISPYAYCNNNPIKFVDPTGMSYTYNWDTNEYEYIDEDGNKKTVSQEEALSKSGANKNAKTYDFSLESGIKSFKKDFSLGGIIDQIGCAFMDLFSIREDKITPDGENYSKYTARNWQNSGPDYISIDGSYTTYPILLHEGNLSLGYVKGDGLFLLNTWGVGMGANISSSIGISVGKYNGEGEPNAQSLSGVSYKISGGVGMIGASYSQDITNNYVGKNWSIKSVSYGPGVTPVSVSGAITYTLSPLYIYRSKK